MNEYTAKSGRGLVGLVSATLGYITHLDVRPGLGYIVKAAYVV